MPKESLSKTLSEEWIAIKIFEIYPNAIKIKKPKIGQKPEPTRITDKDGHVIAYPIIKKGNVEFTLQHPKEGESFQFAFSYTCDEKKIFKSQKLLGTGEYGHVKNAILAQSSTSNQRICMKTQLISNQLTANEKALRKKQIQLEYNNLHDLNQTAGNLIERESKNGIKLIIPLKYLGRSLNNFSHEALDKKLSISTDLLLQVDALHHGRLSKTGTAYVHRDIKPENVMLDSSGVVHLTDFGLTKVMDKDDLKIPETDIVGTSDYAPFDTDFSTETPTPEEELSENYQRPVIKYIPANHRETDTIATLRTIFHPDPYVNEDPRMSLLTSDEFKLLPQPLQQLMYTGKIQPFLDKKIDIKLIASALIYYQLTHKINDYQIKLLQNDPLYQDIILNLNQKIKEHPELKPELPNILKSINVRLIVDKDKIQGLKMKPEEKILKADSLLTTVLHGISIGFIKKNITEVKEKNTTSIQVRPRVDN